MKKHTYYLIMLIYVLVALIFFKHRNIFLIRLNPDGYDLQTAQISSVCDKSLIHSTTQIIYEADGVERIAEIECSEQDVVGKIITIYTYRDKFVYRTDFVKKLDVFSMLIITVLVLIVVQIIRHLKYGFGYYQNKIYCIVWFYGILFSIGVYAAAKANRIDLLLYMFLVWGQAMVVLSVIARQVEVRELNAKLLEQYSNENAKFLI